MEDKFKALIACFGIGSVTVIEVVNLTVTGMNGTVASAIVAAIAGIVGVAIGAKIGKG